MGPPPLNGTTEVTLVISSTTNDELAEYDVNIQGITLTSESGKTVTLLGTAVGADFIHVDGAAEPMLTVTVPQDVYSAAQVSINSSASANAIISATSITCLSLASTGGLIVNTLSNDGVVATNVTLPEPITIAGSSLGLTLNMQVSQSAQFSSCANGTGVTYSFTPTFTMSAFAVPATSPSVASVLSTLSGQVSAVDAENDSLQLALASLSGRVAPLTVKANASTLIHGFAGLDALVAGQFVQVDGSLQADGSVQADRIALADSGAVDVQQGPVLIVDSSVPYLTMYPLMEQGQDGRIDTEVFDFANASFQIGGQFTNLSALPFAPSFTATTMVAGQNVYISSPAFNYYAPPDYTAVASTITLEPQILDGTIVASTTSDGFTVYTVQLAAYDLFPAMAQQDGQTTVLSSPTMVQVYVDSSTQQFSAQPPADGAVLRFYGLVFNDAGALRMDCGRINDGVAL